MSIKNISPIQLPEIRSTAWDMCTHAGQIVLTFVSADSPTKLHIWTRSVHSDDWREVFATPLTVTDSIAVTSRTLRGDCCIQIKTAENVEFLTSSDSATFTRVSELSDALESFFSIPEIFEIGGSEFGLMEKDSLVQLVRRSTTGWDPIDLPAGSGTPSQLVVWDNALWIAFNAPTQGCKLFSVKVEADGTMLWNLVFDRGADRYAANADVLCLVPTNSSLLVACGRTPSPTTVLQEGFEILEVLSDGSWDLLIGLPRVSRWGLRIPLSQKGPGLNEFDPATLCFLFSDQTGSFLGTYRAGDGFKIWRYTEEFRWIEEESGELLGCNDVRRARVVALNGQSVIVLDIDHALRGRCLNVWASGS